MPRWLDAGGRWQRQIGTGPSSGTRLVVVPVGPDEEDVAALRVRGERGDQIERWQVGPLKIVQEDRERPIVTRDRGDETSDGRLESAARLEARSWLNRGLFSQIEQDKLVVLRQAEESFRKRDLPFGVLIVSIVSVPLSILDDAGLPRYRALTAELASPCRAAT